jgi:hypothetical protein
MQAARCQSQSQVAGAAASVEYFGAVGEFHDAVINRGDVAQREQANAKVIAVRSGFENSHPGICTHAAIVGLSVRASPLAPASRSRPLNEAINWAFAIFPISAKAPDSNVARGCKSGLRSRLAVLLLFERRGQLNLRTGFDSNVS